MTEEQEETIISLTPERRSRKLQGVQAHSQILRVALQSIQRRVRNLSKDWSTRPKDFWEGIIQELQSLRKALHPFLALVDSSKRASGFATVEYELVVPVNYCNRLIDAIGVAVTAYIPIATSMSKHDLQQRQDLLERLRDLCKAGNEVLTTYERICREKKERDL